MNTVSQAGDRLLLGLIGSGIMQSKAGKVQMSEGAAHGLHIHYQLIDLDRTGLAPADAVATLPDLITAAKIMGFSGLNITYPCKQAVVPLLDDLSQEAAAMQAVNVVTFRDGRLTGHNTDGPGWAMGLRQAMPDADLSRVVLMGCGGAGAAVAHAALGQGVGTLFLADQDNTRAAILAQALSDRFGAGRAVVTDDPRATLKTATGFIHATPVGMLKSPGMPIPAETLHAGLWVSDLVYVPLETELLRVARARGCQTMHGGHMNIGQGALGFGLFTGLPPDFDRISRNFHDLIALD